MPALLPAEHGWPPFMHRLRRRPLHRDLRRLHRAGARTTPSSPTGRASASTSKTCASPKSPRAPAPRSGPIRWRSIRAPGGARSRARSPSGWPQVSQALEKRGYAPEEVALFLMRCLFTMFAEDVELLPQGQLRGAAARSASPSPPTSCRMRGPALGGDGRGADCRHALQRRVLHFNGEFFKQPAALPLEPRGDRRTAGRRPSRTGGTSSRRSSARCWKQALDPGRAHEARRALHAARLCRAAGGRHGHRAAARRVGAGARPPRRSWRDEGDRKGGHRGGARRSTTGCARRGCSTRPAAPATSSTSRWST